MAKNISRRGFITVTGAATAGLAAFGSMGIYSDWGGKRAGSKNK